MEIKRISSNDIETAYIDFNLDELKFIKRAVSVIASSANRLQSSLTKVNPVDYNVLRVNGVVRDISDIINSSLLFAELMTDAQHRLLTNVNNSKS